MTRAIVPAQNRLGSTSGVAIPAGCIGEVQTFSHSGAGVTTTTGGTAVDVYTFTLNKGIYLLAGDFSLLSTIVSTTGAIDIAASVLLTDNTPTILYRTTCNNEKMATASAATATFISNMGFNYVLVVASDSSIYRIRVLSNQTNTVGAVSLQTHGGTFSGSILYQTTLQAIRVA
jgi:hypothetical protein